jgi:hypothetical protein
LCKLVNRFPQINPYWLLGDAEEMHNSNAQKSTTGNSVSSPGGLFDLPQAIEEKSENYNIHESAQNRLIPQPGKNNIEKIIIIYDDQTFEELRPKR